MAPKKPNAAQRQRAPSRRSLATRERILDAAEEVFADRGFDGATMRNIASAAGETLSLVHHHGGGKEALFHKVIARRANDLAAARIEALAAAQEGAAPLTIEAILSAFITPLLTRAADDDGWRAYTRLIAHVSADERWRDLAASRFDPTALRFIEAVTNTAPNADARAVAAGFVYAISATLAHVAAEWRIGALSRTDAAPVDAAALIAFCAGGLKNLANLERFSINLDRPD